jgi:hypothetical protein
MVGHGVSRHSPQRVAVTVIAKLCHYRGRSRVVKYAVTGEMRGSAKVMQRRSWLAGCDEESSRYFENITG